MVVVVFVFSLRLSKSDVCAVFSVRESPGGGRYCSKSTSEVVVARSHGTLEIGVKNAQRNNRVLT